MSELNTTLALFRPELRLATSPEAVQDLRTKYLGKKSYVKTALKSLGAMSAEERPVFAKEVNDAQHLIERELDEATERVARGAAEKQIAGEWQDLTLPGI